MEESIRKVIKLEIQHTFPGQNIDSMINLYERFSLMDTDVEKGIKSDWIDNLSHFFLNPDSIRSTYSSIVNSEGFFKKILFVINPSKYSEIVADKSLGLKTTFDFIGLSDLFPPKTNFSTANISNFSDPIQKAIVQTYQLRNSEAHSSPEWSFSEMANNVHTILVASIYAVWLNRGKIVEAIEKHTNKKSFDIENDLKRIVKAYNEKMQKGFKYFQFFWDLEGGKSPDAKNMRIKELLNEKQLMLVGDAGTGKTTAIDYLEYQDAKAYITGESQAIPVKICLIDENESRSLIDMICQHLQIPASYCEALLKKNRIHLYVDGLNELSLDLNVKKRFIIEIEKFLTLYPDIFAVFSDRKYSPIQLKIEKKYILRRLGKEEVLAYAQTKPEYTETVKTKMLKILSSPDFSDLEYTPLLLNQLITVFLSSDKIPEDPSELIGYYLDSLMKREYEEKRDINAANGRLDLLLMKLASIDIPEEGLPLHRVMKVFASAMQEYGIIAGSDECINLAIQLGILKKTHNNIDFLIEEYRNYYIMKALEIDL